MTVQGNAAPEAMPAQATPLQPSSTSAGATNRWSKLSFNPARDMVQGENLESEMTIHPLSQLRSYVVGVLLIFVGISLFAEQAYLLVGALVLAYFIYKSSFESAGGFIKSFIKIVIVLFLLYLASIAAEYITTFLNVGGIANLLGGANGAGAGGSGSNPFAGVSANSFFVWLNGMIEIGFKYAAPYVDLVTLLIIAGGAWAIYGSYRYTKGQRVFFTDRRLIILKKFGGSSMFQATMDAVSDVSSNRGVFGRLFGYGAVYVTTESGSGVNERDSNKKSKVGRALGGVKLTVDGIRNPEEAVNIFEKIRMQFMQSLQLKEIEKYTKIMAEATQKPPEQVATLSAEGKEFPVAKKTTAVAGSKCTWCGKGFSGDELTYSCPKCGRPYHTYCLEGALAREKACPECGAEMMVP